MADLRLTAIARRDLEDIGDRSLSEFGPDTANSHLLCSERIFALLRERPFAGAARPEFGPAIRSFSHPSHRILYKAQRDQVTIVRVIHQARDVRRAMTSRR